MCPNEDILWPREASAAKVPSAGTCTAAARTGLAAAAVLAALPVGRSVRRASLLKNDSKREREREREREAKCSYTHERGEENTTSGGKALLHLRTESRLPFVTK